MTLGPDMARELGVLGGKMDLVIANQSRQDIAINAAHRRIDKHSRWINAMKGAIAVVAAAIGYALYWIRTRTA